MNTHRGRVMIIDEDAGVRDALGRLLRRHNMDVATTVSGERALRRLREGEPFDCLILDLLLPDMPGREVIEAIAREELFDMNRIIILTAVHNVDNATAYMQFGCSSYCGKPYDNARILEQIFRACRISPNEHGLDAII